MNIRQMKKYLFPIAMLVFLGFSMADQFDDYTQGINGEEVAIEMIAISGSEFEMGTDLPNRNPNEKPAHTLKLNDFWMGKYEITWEQYDAFVYGKFEEEGILQNHRNLYSCGCAYFDNHKKSPRLATTKWIYTPWCI